MFLFLGIVLTLLSYLSFRFGTSIKGRIEKKNKKLTKSRVQDEFFIPTGNEAIEVLRYVFGSEVLFVMGLLISVIGIYH